MPPPPSNGVRHPQNNRLLVTDAKLKRNSIAVEPSRERVDLRSTRSVEDVRNVEIVTDWDDQYDVCRRKNGDKYDKVPYRRSMDNLLVETDYVQNTRRAGRLQVLKI